MTIQKQDHPSIKVCVTGISGTGKSTLLEKLIRRENARWIFIFDHKQGDFARRFGVKPCYTLNDLQSAVKRGGVVIFDPAEFTLDDAPKEIRDEFSGLMRVPAAWAFFCKFVWEVSQVIKGKKILATDELDFLVDATSEPEDLTLILDQGRTFQIDCFFICQAMNGIHNQVRKQITEIFVMIQGDKNSTKWLVDNRGFEENTIKDLKHGEFLYFNGNTGQREKGGKAFVPKNAVRNLRGL